MARAYTVATAALALQVNPKWIDNALSHYPVQGVVQSRQGVPRRLSIESLTILALALIFNRELEIPLAKAVDIATELIPLAGKLTLPAGIKIEVGFEQITTALLKRLEHAVEVAPLPRRGRPRQTTTGRLD